MASLDLPAFDGTGDVEQWIRHFRLVAWEATRTYGNDFMANERKHFLLKAHLAGDAAVWYADVPSAEQHLVGRNLARLQERYGNALRKSIAEALNPYEQEENESLSAYVSRGGKIYDAFAKVPNRPTHFTDVAKKFIAGLNDAHLKHDFKWVYFNGMRLMFSLTLGRNGQDYRRYPIPQYQGLLNDEGIEDEKEAHFRFATDEMQKRALWLYLQMWRRLVIVGIQSGTVHEARNRVEARLKANIT